MIGLFFLFIQYSLIKKIALTDKTSSPLKMSTPQNQIALTEKIALTYKTSSPLKISTPQNQILTPQNFFLLNPKVAFLSLIMVGLSSKNQFSTLLVSEQTEQLYHAYRHLANRLYKKKHQKTQD